MSYGLTERKLEACFPQARRSAIEAYSKALNDSFAEAGVKTAGQAALYLTQIGVESFYLRWMADPGDWRHLDHETELGNGKAGDGELYKPRGALKIYGKNEYAACGKDCKIDLLKDPGGAALPEVCFKVSAWVWRRKNAASLVSLEDTYKALGFKSAPRRDERAELYETIKTVLGLSPEARV